MSKKLGDWPGRHGEVVKFSDDHRETTKFSRTFLFATVREDHTDSTAAPNHALESN
jgi:hypothetical protein